MSFKYIGKQRQVDELGRLTWAQLINVPALERCQRCRYCVFYERERSLDGYLDCRTKHKCGNESLLWSQLTNSMSKSWWKPQYFSPTLQLRQIKIDYSPRYLQYISADIDGYQCNSYCQYYPERIKAEQTVADCASSHSCGKNGSFFDILTLDDMTFDNVPDFDILPLGENDFVTFDGTVITNPVNISFRILSNEYVQIKLDSSDWLYVLNWLRYSTNAGALLKAPAGLPRTYHFEADFTLSQFQPEQLLVLTSESSRLGRYLTTQGMSATQLLEPFYNYIEFHLPDSTRVVFVQNYLYFEVQLFSNTYVLLITNILSLQKYIVKMTGRTGKLLGSPIESTEPSLMRWVDNPWANTEPYPSITITDYEDQYSGWLRSCGLRPSLFY